MPDEAMDTHRESSGQAPIAGVGEVSGEGEPLLGMLSVAMAVD
jgi:hypothetical protein